MSNYENVRRRMRNYNGKDISDKEIIELLEEEIKQYRRKIQEQRELKDLPNQEDIKITKTEMITFYAEGKPIETIIKYKYAEEE